MSYKNHSTKGNPKQSAACQFSGNPNKIVNYDVAALQDLMDRGGILIPLYPLGHADEKTPLRGRSWLKKPYAWPEILAHVRAGGLVGLAPASLGFVVLDVDEGDPHELLAVVRPAVAAPSSRPGRMHLYFHDPKACRRAGNGKWRWSPRVGGQAVAGEIRSGNGYVALYGGCAEHLLAFLSFSSPDSAPSPSSLFFSSPFPAHLLDRQTEGYPRASGGRKVAASGLKDDNQTSRPLRAAAQGRSDRAAATVGRVDELEYRRRRPEDLPEPEETPERWRNDTLFDYVRYHAATLDIQAGQWGARRFYAQVRSYALAIRARMPDPEPVPKVMATANSICRYYLEGGQLEGQGENYTTLQRQYGGYNKARNIRIANEEWDLEVWELWLSGMSIRKLASTGKYGSRGRIEHVLRRYKEWYPGAVARRDDQMAQGAVAAKPVTTPTEPEAPVEAADEQDPQLEEDMAAAAGDPAVVAKRLAYWLDEQADRPRYRADWSAWWGSSGRGPDPPS